MTPPAYTRSPPTPGAIRSQGKSNWSKNMNLAGYSLMVLPPLEGTTSLRSALPKRECERLLVAAQMLRARIFLADTALVASTVDSSGRYIHPLDRQSWHVLICSPQGSVCGTLRVTVHDDECGVDDLTVSECPVFAEEEWRLRGRGILASFLQRASAARVRAAETGGWALDESLRGGKKGALLALSGWAVIRLVGGAKILGAVTTRHGASRMTRYLGGLELADAKGSIPAYFDPRYGCDMELIEFDSQQVNPAFEPTVQAICNHFLGMLVQPSADPTRLCAFDPVDPVVDQNLAEHFIPGWFA